MFNISVYVPFQGRCRYPYLDSVFCKQLLKQDDDNNTNSDDNSNTIIISNNNNTGDNELMSTEEPETFPENFNLSDLLPNLFNETNEEEPVG